jgi:hypothetical protein
MAEVVAQLIGARPMQAMIRATERRTSSSERRRSWCARGGEECDGRKGFPTGAAMAGSPAGREMADSDAYLAEVSLKWLSEVS